MTSFIVKHKRLNSIIILGVYTSTERFFYQDFKQKILKRLSNFPENWSRAFEDFELDNTKFARSTTLESRLIVTGLHIDNSILILEQVGAI